MKRFPIIHVSPFYTFFYSQSCLAVAKDRVWQVGRERAIPCAAAAAPQVGTGSLLMPSRPVQTPGRSQACSTSPDQTPTPALSLLIVHFPSPWLPPLEAPLRGRGRRAAHFPRYKRAKLSAGQAVVPPVAQGKLEFFLGSPQNLPAQTPPVALGSAAASNFALWDYRHQQVRTFLRRGWRKGHFFWQGWSLRGCLLALTPGISAQPSPGGSPGREGQTCSLKGGGDCCKPGVGGTSNNPDPPRAVCSRSCPVDPAIDGRANMSLAPRRAVLVSHPLSRPPCQVPAAAMKLLHVALLYLGSATFLGADAASLDVASAFRRK